MSDKKSPTLFDTCLKITSIFEGSDYGTVTENFDGMGISCGILQFNLGTGTLQAYILNHINEMYFKFPKSIMPIVESKKEMALIWHKDNCCDENGHLKPEWKKAWVNFMLRPEVINLQKQACNKYFQRAREICGILGFSHEHKRAMAWAYDLAVQSWSLGIDRPRINHEQANNILQLYGPENYNLWSQVELTDDQVVLVIASHLRALKCKPEWRKAFFVRKCTLAVGLGIVNGEKHDFRKTFTGY